MRGDEWLLGLVLLGVGWPGLVVGQDVDMEEVRRRAEIYTRDLEAEKPAPAPKPRLKPAPAPKPQPKPVPTVNYDHEAWKSAERCGTAACFEAYLEEYPKGRYARMARARLKTETEPMPSSAPPSLSSQAEALRAAAAREAAARAAAAREAPRAAAAREAAPIELQSRPMTSAPARVPVIPTTPNGGSVVGSYAMQVNANAVRDYYRSQKIRAVVEEVMANGRAIYQVRIWR